MNTILARFEWDGVFKSIPDWRDVVGTYSCTGNQQSQFIERGFYVCLCRHGSFKLNAGALNGLRKWRSRRQSVFRNLGEDRMERRSKTPPRRPGESRREATPQTSSCEFHAWCYHPFRWVSSVPCPCYPFRISIKIRDSNIEHNINIIETTLMEMRGAHVQN